MIRETASLTAADLRLIAVWVFQWAQRLDPTFERSVRSARHEEITIEHPMTLGDDQPFVTITQPASPLYRIHLGNYRVFLEVSGGGLRRRTQAYSGTHDELSARLSSSSIEGLRTNDILRREAIQYTAVISPHTGERD